MKFVILHGSSADHTSNWFPWLKNELENLGHEVWVPDLPNSSSPNIGDYNKFLLESGYDFSNTVLIGHSSGSVSICGLLQNLPDNVKINLAILAGTFRGDLGWDSLHGVNIPFDYKKIKTKARKFLVIHSNNDPYCPLEGAKWIANQLEAEFKLFTDMGHFSLNLDPRFDKFPKLLEVIKTEVS